MNIFWKQRLQGVCVIGLQDKVMKIVGDTGEVAPEHGGYEITVLKRQCVSWMKGGDVNGLFSQFGTRWLGYNRFIFVDDNSRCYFFLKEEEKRKVKFMDNRCRHPKGKICFSECLGESENGCCPFDRPLIL